MVALLLLIIAVESVFLIDLSAYLGIEVME